MAQCTQSFTLIPGFSCPHSRHPWNLPHTAFPTLIKVRTALLTATLESLSLSHLCPLGYFYIRNFLSLYYNMADIDVEEVLPLLTLSEKCALTAGKLAQGLLLSMLTSFQAPTSGILRLFLD